MKFKLKTESLRKISMVFEFLIRFNLLAIPMYAIIIFGLDMQFAQSLIADALHFVLTSFGYDAVKDGTVLMLSSTSGSAIISIGADCTAWKSAYALAALMLASPVANDKKKFAAIAAGVAAILAINMARILTTALSGYWFGFHTLEIVHSVLWQEGMILAILAIWAVWFKKQKVIFRGKQTILSKIGIEV